MDAAGDEFFVGRIGGCQMIRRLGAGLSGFDGVVFVLFSFDGYFNGDYFAFAFKLSNRVSVKFVQNGYFLFV